VDIGRFLLHFAKFNALQPIMMTEIGLICAPVLMQPIRAKISCNAADFVVQTLSAAGALN